MRRKVAVAVATIIVALPTFTFAFPFGGRIVIYHDCPFNAVKYALIGGPRGGQFIWTAATRTYQFGPPRGPGQWILGLSGVPYFCIYSIFPLLVDSGITITMMGSSR